MNEGKKFELAFKNSVPENVYYFRIPDPAESFSSIKTGLRFTIQNPCDIFLYNPDTKTMYALELKAHRILLSLIGGKILRIKVKSKLL